MASVGGVKSGGLPQSQAWDKPGKPGRFPGNVPATRGGSAGSGGMSVKGAGKALAAQIVPARCGK